MLSFKKERSDIKYRDIPICSVLVEKHRAKVANMPSINL